MRYFYLHICQRKETSNGYAHTLTLRLAVFPECLNGLIYPIPNKYSAEKINGITDSIRKAPIDKLRNHFKSGNSFETKDILAFYKKYESDSPVKLN